MFYSHSEIQSSSHPFFPLPSSLLFFFGLPLFLFHCLANCHKATVSVFLLKMKTAEHSFIYFDQEMAVCFTLLCNVVIYCSMWTISVNHVLP